jgi:glycerophosphoryl diester phosphodiesterase
LSYHHTKDGVPVVIHDFTLDRTTDAKRLWGGSGLNVADRTAEELRALDAGGWFASQYAGTGLPTLVETLEIIQAQGMALIERKGGQPATILRLIREKGWVNRLIVQSFDWEYLSVFHELEPRQVLGALGPPRTLADGRNATKFSGRSAAGGSTNSKRPAHVSRSGTRLSAGSRSAWLMSAGSRYGSIR